MRDLYIAELHRTPFGRPMWLAGRVETVQAAESGLTGTLRDETGCCEFLHEIADRSRPGDIVRLLGAPGPDGCFRVRELILLLRPDRDPSDDPEYRRLSATELRTRLVHRAALSRAIREYFDGQGFLEVETGQLVDEPGQEPTLIPFRCGNRFLVTSPELRLKRMLSAGFERIYELSHAFRSGPGECTNWHQPEFSMLEWYRAYADSGSLIADLEALLRQTALAVIGRPRLRRGDRSLDLDRPFERLTVQQAFERHAGVDLEPFLDGDADRFRASARSAHFQVAENEAAETLFFRILIDRVESRLGLDQPTILYDFPAEMAALARVDPGDPRVCRRFECYALGVELANAFEELNDVAEQRRRFVAERQRKRAAGEDSGPWPEKFLSALARGLPPTAGIALGVDRLLMLLIGTEQISDTLPFPEEV